MAEAWVEKLEQAVRCLEDARLEIAETYRTLADKKQGPFLARCLMDTDTTMARLRVVIAEKAAYPDD